MQKYKLGSTFEEASVAREQFPGRFEPVCAASTLAMAVPCSSFSLSSKSSLSSSSTSISAGDTWSLRASEAASPSPLLSEARGCEESCRSGQATAAGSCYLGRYLEDIRPVLMSLQMKTIINNHWSDILANMPCVFNGTVKVDETRKRDYQRETSPSVKIIEFLITRRVKVDDLYCSFESLQLDDGLMLLNKPLASIQIKSAPAPVITLKSGASHQLTVEAVGFPSPVFEIYCPDKASAGRVNSNTLRINSAKQSDSGDYVWIIKQKNGDHVLSSREIKIQVNVLSNWHNERLVVNVQPSRFDLLVGANAIDCMQAVTNEVDPSLLIFKWFKLNSGTNQIEWLDTPLDRVSVYGMQLSHEGEYSCEVTHRITGETVRSANSCKLVLDKPSEQDLKLALLIGNGKYTLSHADRNCSRCNDLLKLDDLNVYASIDQLKSKLEAFGYMVMAFVDLSAEYYLRVVRLFRTMSAQCAGNVSVLIYVTGHGFHDNNNDYLVPIDARTIYHNNGHNLRELQRNIRLSSRANLFGSFVPISDENNHLSIVCLWDMCRVDWSDMKMNDDVHINFESQLDDTLDYSLLYSCNIGKKEYEIKERMSTHDLLQGSVFVNMFVKTATASMNIHQIGESINYEIKQLKLIDPYTFGVLSNVKYDSTCWSMMIGSKANNNAAYMYLFDQFSVDDAFQHGEIYSNNKELICTYRFESDVFINSLIMEVSFSDRITKLNLQLLYPKPFTMTDMNDSFDSNKKRFRIFNVLSNSAEYVAYPMLTFEFKGSGFELKKDIMMTNYFNRLEGQLNADHIDEFVEGRRSPCTDQEANGQHYQNICSNTSEENLLGESDSESSCWQNNDSRRIE